MYRGTETSSSFYMSMRNAFANPGGAPTPYQPPQSTSVQMLSSSSLVPQGSGNFSIAEIQHRLMTTLGTTGRAPGSQHPPPGGPSLVATTPAVEASPPPPPPQPTVVAAPVVPVAPPPPPQQQQQSNSGEDDDESLTPAELRSLKMVEFATIVRVMYGELQQPPKPLRLMAEEAVVRIFPRHVSIAKPQSSAAYAELVIVELVELTEDVNRGTLTFHAKKVNTQTVSIVEIRCNDAATRSAIYKIVCSKRSIIEKEQVKPQQATS